VDEDIEGAVDLYCERRTATYDDGEDSGDNALSGDEATGWKERADLGVLGTAIELGTEVIVGVESSGGNGWSHSG
jgi:hypothetical protein